MAQEEHVRAQHDAARAAEASMDALQQKLRALPTVRRVIERTPKTVAAQAQRMARGAAAWSDTPGRTDIVPMVVDRASGSKLYDLDGTEYVDLMLGVWTAILGHAPAPVVEAVQREVTRGLNVGMPHALETELSEILVEHVACAEVSFLANSGTEAVMHALKLARAATGRKRVVKFDLHYHGHANDLLGDLVEFRHGMPVPGEDGTLVLPRHTSSFARIRELADQIACVIIEPASPGRDLLFEFEPDFFSGLRALTKELGIVLVFDEVFWGFRNRFGGTFDERGIVPDVAVFGKIIGGGLPIGAVVGRRDIMTRGISTGNPVRDAATRVPILGTFAGNRLVCAAGVAQMRHLERHRDELYPYMRRQCERLVEEVHAHAAARGYPVRLVARGGIFFPRIWTQLAEPRTLHMPAMLVLGAYLRDQGVFYTGGAAQLTPAHSDEDVRHLGVAFKAALDAMHDEGMLARG